MEKASAGMSRGALHRSLKVPAGEKIPATKLAVALRSRNPRIKKMATLAETFAAHRPKAK